MSLVAHAALFVVFVWWFATGAIIYLDGLPARTFKVSMAVATALLVGAIHGLSEIGTDASLGGAYWAFTFALIAWGWNEMGFLMGLITGPRDTACPPEAKGFTRFWFAVQAVIYHEAAIALTGFAIWAVSAGGPNQVGVQTFALLWIMRLSAKINVYLGVPNITEEFLPPHLKYLKSYFRNAPMNAVFPVSITASTVLAVWLAQQACAPQATAFDVTASGMLATLTILALVEHWFMVLPIPSTALWQWGLASHLANSANAASEPPAPAPSTQAATIVPFPALTPATHRRRL